MIINIDPSIMSWFRSVSIVIVEWIEHVPDCCHTLLLLHAFPLNGTAGFIHFQIEFPKSMEDDSLNRGSRNVQVKVLWK